LEIIIENIRIVLLTNSLSVNSGKQGMEIWFFFYPTAMLTPDEQSSMFPHWSWQKHHLSIINHQFIHFFPYSLK
jgi:hypothetical protein